jgi:DNA-binding protein H-NS
MGLKGNKLFDNVFVYCQNMHPDTALTSIRAKIRELELQAKRLERAGKPGISQVQALVSKYKLTRQDVEFALKLANQERKRGIPKGTRLKPKYRNPQNPRETWAGRGLKPRWLSSLLKQGKKLDDLAI